MVSPAELAGALDGHRSGTLSTTQSSFPSRRGSEQVVQISRSVSVQHWLQSFTFSVTSRMASLRATALLARALQEVEREPLRALLADARELRELGDQT